MLSIITCMLTTLSAHDVPPTLLSAEVLNPHNSSETVPITHLHFMDEETESERQHLT